MKKIVWSLILLIGVAVAFAAAPKWMKFAAKVDNASVAPPPKEEKIIYTAEQKAKFKELVDIYAHLDSSKKVFMTGTMTCIDPSDSSQNLSTTFKYCRKENELYYQAGESEMVALKNLYLAISTNAKKVFVSESKAIIDPFMVSTDSLISIFQNNSYNMEYSTGANGTTIRFLCPEHVYCKEYSFDIKDNKISGMFMRLTDLRDPLNTAKDKKIRMTVNEWTETSLPLDLIKEQTYLNKSGNNIKLSSRYAEYELINYLNVNPN